MKKLSFPVLFLPATPWAAQGSAQTVTAKPWEKLLGSWKEIPGPDTPVLIKVEPRGDDIKFSFGCKQDGSCPDVILANYDGKRYKDADNAIWENSYRKKGERIVQEEAYFSGRLSNTKTWQVSADGNTLTTTIHYVNPQDRNTKLLSLIEAKALFPRMTL
jgi:hypothetical protein